MKPPRKTWAILGRGLLCLVLLGWVFQAIFATEGRQALELAGQHWDDLGFAARFQVAWTHGPAALLQTLRQLEPVAGGLSLLFMGLTLLLGMLRWRMVLHVQGIDLSVGRAAEISLVAHFFNSFLLGSTGGDLMKAYYAARETHHLKTEAVMTVVVDRLIGLLSMLLFAAVMMLPNHELLGEHRRLWALAGTVIFLLTAGLLLWLLRA